MNNLRQVALGEIVWSNDHRSTNLPAGDAGFGWLLSSGDITSYYLALSNELVSPKILACPSDSRNDMIHSGDFVNPAGLTDHLARSNYVACYGNTPFLGQSATVLSRHLVIGGISGRGIFYRNSRTRIADEHH